ncbi:Uncharacterised protein [Mycobacteroides abscessus subsp. abscessus]|nr:Uncharacterised protein [Mycobacteroides abscessus subsp. abscessus]
MRFAASVGVEARRSATSSRIGRSASCPIAETTGVVAFETARTSASFEKGSRSSMLPPPRAMTMMSISGSASSSARFFITPGTASGPWTAVLRISNSAAGQRMWTLRTTSFCASESRPVMSPIRLGRNGRRFFLAGSKRPSAASCFFSRSSLARSSPRPTARMSLARIVRRPVFVQKSALRFATTWLPSDSSAPVRSRTFFQIWTGRDISTSVSRRVR